MTFSKLTIVFQKGRKGTLIGKIVEVPEIVVRGTSQTEVRDKLLEALTHYQKQSLTSSKRLAT